MNIKPEVHDFIERLRHLTAGDRARLKRSAGKTLEEARCTGLFYSLLPYAIPLEKEAVYFLVATLYPYLPDGGSGNFCSAVRLARSEKNAKGMDRRMEILLDADESQLPFRLRQMVYYLKTNDISIDWQSLLQDLLYWNHPDRFVQKEWARAYFIGR